MKIVLYSTYHFLLESPKCLPTSFLEKKLTFVAESNFLKTTSYFDESSSSQLLTHPLNL